MMEDMALLKKALLRPKRYAGLALEAMVCIFNAPERVEDEVAHVLSLPVGDAVELETICFLEDGHAVTVIFHPSIGLGSEPTM